MRDITIKCLQSQKENKNVVEIKGRNFIRRGELCKIIEYLRNNKVWSVFVEFSKKEGIGNFGGGVLVEFWGQKLQFSGAKMNER